MTIVMPATPPLRNRALMVWIQVCTHLLSLQNYSSLNAVLSALTSPPVTRLTKTWATIPRKIERELEELKRLMDPLVPNPGEDNSSIHSTFSSNTNSIVMKSIPGTGWRWYRERLKKSKGIFIPVLEVHYEDGIENFIKILENWRTMIPSSLLSSFPNQDGIINTSHPPNLNQSIHSGSGSSISSISNIGSSNLSSLPSFVFQENRDLAVMHWLVTHSWISEDRLWQESCIREPPPSPPSSVSPSIIPPQSNHPINNQISHSSSSNSHITSSSSNSGSHHMTGNSKGRFASAFGFKRHDKHGDKDTRSGTGITSTDRSNFNNRNNNSSTSGNTGGGGASSNNSNSNNASSTSLPKYSDIMSYDQYEQPLGLPIQSQNRSLSSSSSSSSLLPDDP